MSYDPKWIDAAMMRRFGANTPPNSMLDTAALQWQQNKQEQANQEAHLRREKEAAVYSNLLKYGGTKGVRDHFENESRRSELLSDSLEDETGARNTQRGKNNILFDQLAGGGSSGGSGAMDLGEYVNKQAHAQLSGGGGGPSTAQMQGREGMQGQKNSSRPSAETIRQSQAEQTGKGKGYIASQESQAARRQKATSQQLSSNPTAYGGMTGPDGQYMDKSLMGLLGHRPSEAESIEYYNKGYRGRGIAVPDSSREGGYTMPGKMYGSASVRQEKGPHGGNMHNGHEYYGKVPTGGGRGPNPNYGQGLIGEISGQRAPGGSGPNWKTGEAQMAYMQGIIDSKLGGMANAVSGPQLVRMSSGGSSPYPLSDMYDPVTGKPGGQYLQDIIAQGYNPNAGSLSPEEIATIRANPRTYSNRNRPNPKGWGSSLTPEYLNSIGYDPSMARY